MRILFLGDVVGRSGRKAVTDHLPELRRSLAPDVVVANGENAAGGFGITEAIFNELTEAGVDAVTLGNHAWDQRETLTYIDRTETLVRPINFPRGTPGRGWVQFTSSAGKRVLVINAMGRIFMEPLDDPFAAVNEVLEMCTLGAEADAIIIDFHAEASSEKQAFGYFVDGRASLVVGTHTHVPTADHRVLSGGTAFITDVGMCGDYNSVIGMEKTEPINRFTRRISESRMEPGKGEGSVCGVVVDLEPGSGKAQSIQPLRLGGVLEATGAGAFPTS